MPVRSDVEQLTEAEARGELARLAQALAEANRAYHTLDAPEITDAEYDALKRRNAAIEARFPTLKRADSPSDQVGGGLGGGSSNAATLMILLNALWELRLPPAELARLALSLGADVPVCLAGHPARMQGVEF